MDYDKLRRNIFEFTHFTVLFLDVKLFDYMTSLQSIYSIIYTFAIKRQHKFCTCGCFH